MRKPYRKRQVLSLGLLASLAGTAAIQYAMAASAPPVFSPTAQTAWVGIGIGAFLPVLGSPKPIGQDPAHRSQTRMCSIPASGSSRVSFARGCIIAMNPANDAVRDSPVGWPVPFGGRPENLCSF
jgi:hypothetical protein